MFRNNLIIENVQTKLAWKNLNKRIERKIWTKNWTQNLVYSMFVVYWIDLNKKFMANLNK